MQKLLLFPILTGVILSPCQPSSKTRQEKSSAAPVAPVTADTLSAKATASEEQEEPFEDTPALSYEKRVLSAAEKQQLLTEHNFASLWAMEQRKGAAVYNGFYGPDHYRIEFYFASVTRDGLQLGHFNITGKSRYKKKITPFAGSPPFANKASTNPEGAASRSIANT